MSKISESESELLLVTRSNDNHFKPLASLYSWAGWFESYVVAKQVFLWRGSYDA